MEKRLIDAKALEEALRGSFNELREMYENMTEGPHRGNCASYLICLREAILLTDKQPTIDAVEVVRKPVKGYEGYYEVDQFGRVFSLDRIVRVTDGSRVYDKPLKGGQMKQSMHDKGYKTVALTKDGKTKTVFVHRIVAEAFIPNPDNLPMVNHMDEDKTNNFAENLEWCTASYNRTYGKAIEKHARKLRGKNHTEEHKQKISDSMKKYYGERRKEDAAD